MKRRDFSKKFLWGCSTSSYQVEGNNTNNQWWEWEKTTGHERCGKACDHYNLFEKDFKLIKKLGHNTHRFSIEWSRIEPREGFFDQKEVEHYKEVITSLKNKDILPIVTFHHFTNPLWFERRGGWLKCRNIYYFIRYVRKVADVLHPYTKYWIIINEPNVYAGHSYALGKWPPQHKSVHEAVRVLNNMAKAHRLSYDTIHAMQKKAVVGTANAIIVYDSKTNSIFDRITTHIRNYLFNKRFINAVKNKVDFIGINYYTRNIIEFNIKNPMLGNTRTKDKAEKTDMGWEIYPEGMYRTIKEISCYNKPLMITENGISTTDDKLRCKFLIDHLQQLKRAIDDGFNVIGYLHWSIMDNFEWDYGYKQHFGLVAVNRKTMKRKVKPSALLFRRIIESGKLPKAT
jgi:beta-glucosidase